MSEERQARARQLADEHRARNQAFALSLRGWNAHDGGISSSGSGDGYREITFSWERGPTQPRAELTFRADIDEFDQPMIEVTFPEGFAPPPRTARPGLAATPTGKEAPGVARDDASTFSAISTVSLRGTGLPRIEPDQVCESCDAQGTAGRAVRFADDGAIHEMHRFCAECWPEQQARYLVRWRRDDRRQRDAAVRANPDGQWHGVSTAFEAATWDGPLAFVEHMQVYAASRGRAALRDLRRFADEIYDQRDQLVGAMPDEVQHFIRMYSSRDLPLAFRLGSEA